MAKVVSHHARHLGRHIGFSKIYFAQNCAANFTEISRKHVFAA